MRLDLSKYGSSVVSLYSVISGWFSIFSGKFRSKYNQHSVEDLKYIELLAISDVFTDTEMGE